MRAPKHRPVCERCHASTVARYRMLMDRYLCEACYRQPQAPPIPTGVSASSPLVSGAGQTGQTITIEAQAELELDVSHLQR